jgi:hypothetical protein
MDQNPGCPSAADARPRPWGAACILGLCLALAGCLYGGTELHSQQELSDAAGGFAASRYLVYRSSDDTFHYFQETGKFGPLGPTGKFRIDKRHLALPTLLPGAVITYDQNRGVFRLRDDRGRYEVKTNFVERYTREEERYLKAVAALAPLRAAGSLREKNNAWLEALRGSFAAGHLEEAERYGQELLGLERSASSAELGSSNIHVIHQYLGKIALQRQDLTAAGLHLLASAEETPATPVLTSFGPGMALARDLALAGQWEVVARYLQLCERFWPRRELRDWRLAIEDHRVPQFGNLFYGL